MKRCGCVVWSQLCYTAIKQILVVHTPFINMTSYIYKCITRQLHKSEANTSHSPLLAGSSLGLLHVIQWRIGKNRQRPDLQLTMTDWSSTCIGRIPILQLHPLIATVKTDVCIIGIIWLHFWKVHRSSYIQRMVFSTVNKYSNKII